MTFESIDATEWNEYNGFIEPTIEENVVWNIRQIARLFGTKVFIALPFASMFDDGFDLNVENV